MTVEIYSPVGADVAQELDPVHGFAAETGAASVLLFTAHFGLPVSTTHTITSSILGVRATFLSFSGRDQDRLHAALQTL